MSESRGNKRCPDCGEHRSVSDFGPDRKRPDGLQYYCRSCSRVRNNRYYRERRERAGHVLREKVDVPEGHKYCPACKQVKAVTEFSVNRAARDGLNGYCRGCRSEQGKRHYRRK